MSINKKLLNKTAAVAGPVGFSALTYTGNGSALTVTGVGFHPDLVWVKDRDTAYQHNLYFNSGGTGAAGWALEPSGTSARYTLSGLTGFNSDGFVLGSNAGNNQSSSPNIAYCWKVSDVVDDFQTNDDGNIDATYQLVSATRGISTFTFTTPASPGSGTTVGHGLGTTPDVIIMRRTDATEDWYVYHTAMGANEFLRLNLNNAQATATNLFGTVNSSVFCPSFTLSGNQPCIAWAMNSVAGFSKFSSYTGTGSALSVTGLGFSPNFLIIKDTDSTEQWYMFDTPRGHSKFLHCNNNNAEGTDATTRLTSFDADGFSLGTDGAVNGSGNKYIYMAWSMNSE
tara:strand:+ start:173 stop:1192 length:1020 start_codon:yes stop_codon:yes gene_type:complete